MVHTHTHTHSHTPKPVCKHKDITVLWNQGVHTDREVIANRPNIIILKRERQKTCILIDVAIPVDRHIILNKAEIKLKHKRLCT